MRVPVSHSAPGGPPMPRPIAVPVRQVVLERSRGGQEASRIAVDLGLSPRTVRHLLRRFRELGEGGLRPGYGGPPRPAADDPREAAALAAVALRREHPGWGAPMIRSVLLRDREPASIPSVRALQRRFRREGLGPPPRPE